MKFNVALLSLWFAIQSSLQTHPGTVTLSGSLTHADYERLFEREFDVGPGIQRLKISLDYSGEDRRTVVDLGLRGPAGFRGWSGGGPQNVVIGATIASYGYLPGPIEPGRWAVILGVPNIREGSRDSYSITIEESDKEEPEFPVIRRDAGWFAGDFHSHSGHSDGRVELANGSRVKIPPHRIFDAALRAGLDFIALTDHNTTSQVPVVCRHFARMQQQQIRVVRMTRPIVQLEGRRPSSTRANSPNRLSSKV